MMSHRSLRVSGAVESRVMMMEALNNLEGTPREIVVLNAGMALYAANVASSIPAGIAGAREAIASGAARAKLDQFVRVTRRLAGVVG